MSRFIIAASLSAAAAVTLAGCGHTVYRDTVVERQPVVMRETVIERPAVAQPTLVPSAPLAVAPSTTLIATPGPNAACTLGNSAYPHSTRSCISGFQYQCVDGVWQPLQGVSC